MHTVNNSDPTKGSLWFSLDQQMSEFAETNKGREKKIIQ
jgi:hypothetical protein